MYILIWRNVTSLLSSRAVRRANPSRSSLHRVVVPAAVAVVTRSGGLNLSTRHFYGESQMRLLISSSSIESMKATSSMAVPPMIARWDYQVCKMFQPKRRPIHPSQLPSVCRTVFISNRMKRSMRILVTPHQIKTGSACKRKTYGATNNCI